MVVMSKEIITCEHCGAVYYGCTGVDFCVCKDEQDTVEYLLSKMREIRDLSSVSQDEASGIATESIKMIEGGLS